MPWWSIFWGQFITLRALTFRDFFSAAEKQQFRFHAVRWNRVLESELGWTVERESRGNCGGASDVMHNGWIDLLESWWSDRDRMGALCWLHIGTPTILLTSLYLISLLYNRLIPYSDRLASANFICLINPSYLGVGFLVAILFLVFSVFPGACTIVGLLAMTAFSSFASFHLRNPNPKNPNLNPTTRFISTAFLVVRIRIVQAV